MLINAVAAMASATPSSKLLFDITFLPARVCVMRSHGIESGIVRNQRGAIVTGCRIWLPPTSSHSQPLSATDGRCARIPALAMVKRCNLPTNSHGR